MVQPYGAAPEQQAGRERAPVAEERAQDGEGAALLGADATPKKSKPLDGSAGLTSSVGNLANTIIGSGMLSFPMAMASGGVIPIMITCALSGGVAAFGLYLLSLCAQYTPRRRSSFFAVAQLTFPSAAVFFDAAIAIKCFGVSISYLIISKSLMPNVVASIYHNLTSPNTNPPAWSLNGRIWISLFMVVLVPLCFLRKLDSLRHASYVALFSVAYLTLIVISCYFFPPKGIEPRGEVHLIHFSPSFVSLFPVQVFAFTCAQNLFPIYNELATNNQSRMNIVIGTGIGSAAIVYEVIAVFGYLTFGSKVGANIIAMYPSTSLFIAIGQFAIVLNVLLAYPLQVHPCRNCLDKVFHAGAHAPIKQRTPGVLPGTTPDGNDVVNENEEEIEDEFHPSHEMSDLKHGALTAGIIISGFAIAYFVDDLQRVLAFVGSTGSTTISFILPGLFYWKLTRDTHTSRPYLTKAAFVLACYGFCIFIFCLSFNIYHIFHPPDI